MVFLIVSFCDQREALNEGIVLKTKITHPLAEEEDEVRIEGQ